MNTRPTHTPWLLLLLAISVVLAAPAIGSGAKKKGKRTHLGVLAADIANVETFQVPNNNSSGHSFFYDRQSVPFTVPAGYSFVVTDLFVEPTGTTVNDAKYYLVVIETGSRSFVAQFGGSATHHVAFNGGFVIPGGSAVSARNTTSSSTPVGVRMMGYFVAGEVPATGTAPF